MVPHKLEHKLNTSIYIYNCWNIAKTQFDTHICPKQSLTHSEHTYVYCKHKLRLWTVIYKLCTQTKCVRRPIKLWTTILQSDVRILLHQLHLLTCSKVWSCVALMFATSCSSIVYCQHHVIMYSTFKTPSIFLSLSSCWALSYNVFIIISICQYTCIS